MDWMTKRIFSMMVCAVLLFSLPMAALATETTATAVPDSTDSTTPTAQGDVDQSITNNPDLSDAEKQQWTQWANDEATNADPNGDLTDTLQDAIDDSDQTGDVDISDLELNDALPSNVINILLLGV